MNHSVKLQNIPVVVDRPANTTGIHPLLPYDITKQLLESKRPNIAEIELTLFENCNIECDFCHHDKNSTIGLTFKEMSSKLKIIEQFFIEKQGTVELFQINIVGGELFQDRWMAQLCNDYYELACDINDLAKKYNIPLRIVWVSNFLFKKKEYVFSLIDKLRKANIDNHLIASYDFDGRPISKLYRKNIDWFGPEYIISINLVGTVDSIIHFMDDTDEYFKMLYNTYHIYFDDYIPDKGYSDLIPSDYLMLSWYKFIADNYPKIAPISDLIENDFNYMHCLSLNKITIFPDNSTSNCRWDRYTQEDFITQYDKADNAGMMQRYLDENNCLSCTYFNKCGFRCFTQWDWKDRIRNLDTCALKQFFNYLSDK